MWRRTYLILLLVRIYFALSPSYLHPDEQFQGPEVFAGRIYSYPSQLTWEFTSDRPIRSVFPLWPVYGLPMSVLKWFYHESDQGSPPPELVFHVLRAGMFILSFVLEDWALYELVRTPRYRVPTVVLVASSYVTWTYQTHTFSNSIETLLVLWGLVLIQRIVEDKENLAVLSCVVLSLVAVIGVFNRITFPAFLLVPGLQLLPYFVQRPLALVTLIAFGGFFTLLAIITDTLFYRPSLSSSVLDALRHPVITPLNNFRYNADTNNLATHGLHPHHQHFLANLPQLLGPAFVALALAPFIRSRTGIAVDLRNKRAVAALTGTMILSIFPHQEARFLIPCVPLLLSCLRPLRSRVFLVAWIVFNVTIGFLMGIHHQGGVIPAQLAIPSIVSSPPSPLTDSSGTATQNATVFWWKTYPPPRWLLGNQDNQSLQQPSITTIDLMGIPGPDLVRELDKSVPRNCPSSSSSSSPTAVYLVAPNSATYLDQFNPSSPTSDKSPSSLSLLHQWSYPKHLNLDDLDFAEDGILPTLRRVVGRRGLNVWLVTRSSCVPQSK